jgi:exosome complex RNA-binding protein Csl4
MSKDLEKILEKMKTYQVEDAPKLSAEEQNRIFQMAMKKIDNEKKEEEAQVKAQTRYSRWAKRAAAVAAIVLVFSLGSVAGAAIFHLDSKFARFFATEGDESHNNQVKVQNVKIASQEIDHIKVTADQVIGDDHSVYIMFHLTGVSPDITNIQLKDVDINLDSDDYILNDPVLSGYENDNPYYILEIRTSLVLSGKDITMSVGKIGYANDEGKFVTLSKGGYRLSWNLNYQKQTKDVAVGKKIQIYGGSADLNRVSISPLSVTVYLDQMANTKREVTNPNDRLRVILKDGRIIDSYRMDSGSVLNDYDEVSLGLHTIVKYDDIQEIQFAGITIPISSNPNAEKEYRYTNEKMGITVDMPETLYNMTTPGKVKTEYDDYYKANTDTMHFVGKINETKLDMFIISKIHRVISPEELNDVNPFAKYITASGGCTYVMQTTEEYPDKEGDQFEKIMNKYVQNLLPRINLK